MSLVGPRPTFAYQVEHYDEFQRRRLGPRQLEQEVAVERELGERRTSVENAETGLRDQEGTNPGRRRAV